jgi:hypothetical protein
MQELFGKSFAGDSTVPRVKNGLDAGAWQQESVKPELLQTE